MEPRNVFECFFRNSNVMESCDLTNTRVPRFFSASKPCNDVASTSIESRPVGLRNLGSTCWFNVAVQLLYHIPTFRRMILELEPSLSSNLPTATVEVLCGLQELFVSIMYSEKKLIDPTRAVHSIGKLLGQGQGQQDASEFLGVVLSRIREISFSVVENLFLGAAVMPNLVNSTVVQQFMQYTLHANEPSTLLDLFEASLLSHTQKLTETLPQQFCENLSLPLEKFKQYFTTVPSVFLIELSRLVNGVRPTDLVKLNQRIAFPSVMFMDRFLFENSEQIAKLDAELKDLTTSKKKAEISLRSLAVLLENVPQLEAVYTSYEKTVDYDTVVNFEAFRTLNHTWEAEIQSKMNELNQKSQKLDRQLTFIRNREICTCRPYQLHSIVVHSGQSDGGHYWIYVWDSQQKVWYHIDDNFSHQVTWDAVIQASFGGIQQESSAHCLVYMDALKIHSLLDLKEEYDIGPTDVLRYLKDHTDVRTRHAAYGKNQSISATSATIEEYGHEMDSVSLLFKVLNRERQRLYLLCRESGGGSTENEDRLLHFGVYLLDNQVEFEPFIYWTLLQHFASFALLVEEKTSRVCFAARHFLAYLECSTTQEQKKVFIQWNTAYYQFRLVIRHVMNGITHVFSHNFSAAVPVAVKALYLHHCLINSSLGGPAMSVNPGVIHALIEKSITALSDELLENDLEAVGELACSVLFDAIINWCEYADTENLASASCCCRRIANLWNRKLKHHFDCSLEYASASNLQTLIELQRKLLKVENVLNKPDQKGEPTPFDFKGHIPECPEDGEKLAQKWKQMWQICLDQHILDPCMGTLNKKP